MRNSSVKNREIERFYTMCEMACKVSNVIKLSITPKHKTYLSVTSSVSSKSAYSNTCKRVKTRLRDMQDSWLSKKADEIQSLQIEML